MAEGAATEFGVDRGRIGVEETGDVRDGFVGGGPLDGGDVRVGEAFDERLHCLSLIHI